jgi:hypothetical protein
MAIMQYFPHIVPTLTDDFEPTLRDCAQFTRMRLHPVLDGWISLNRTGEPEELVHNVCLPKPPPPMSGLLLGRISN